MKKVMTMLCFLSCSLLYPQTGGTSDCNSCIEDIFNTYTLKIKYEASQILYPAVKDKNSFFYIMPKENRNRYFKLITNNPMDLKEDKDSTSNIESKKIVGVERISEEEKDKYVSQLTHTPEDFFEEYRDLIQNIKSKEIYLKCLNAELVKGDLSEYAREYISYNFNPPMQSVIFFVSMTKLDFLKIFKEFIFNNNEEILPNSVRAYTYLHCNCKK